jgi:hypothetical protein
MPDLTPRLARGEEREYALVPGENQAVSAFSFYLQPRVILGPLCDSGVGCGVAPRRLKAELPHCDTNTSASRSLDIMRQR